jgi:FkbM family methyltransferase
MIQQICQDKKPEEMSMLRSIAERFSRNTQLKRSLQVSNRSVSIYVSPDSQLKYLKRTFDSDLVNLAISEVSVSDNVWDVGANCGVFAVAAAVQSKGGVVIAIEPDIWLAALIKRTAALNSNQDLKIRVVSIAISDSCSICEFEIAERGRASNALATVGGRTSKGGTRGVDLVPCFDLDSLLSYLPAPKFIKIDIEGAELLAIKGASRILREVRPVFYIEIGDEVLESMQGIFSSANYSTFEVSHNNFLFRPNEA